jgi:hypothetical protein
MKRLLSTLMISVGLMSASSCEAQVKIGNAQISVPAGWHKSHSESERIHFNTEVERQQATISLMTFSGKPNFADFKRICSHRLEAEKADAPNISLMQEEPFEDAGTFGMFYSGEEPGSGRLFSGYITQKGSEVITIYVEIIGVDSKKHFQAFQDVVKGLKR